MLALLRRLLFGSLLPLCFASCSSFAFERQAIGVAYDPAEDLLELRLLYVGVHGNQKTSADVVRAIAKGKRHFIVHDWPLDIDLEEVEESAAEDWEEEDEVFPDPETVGRIVAFLGAIDVTEAELFLDESQRLCLFHKVSIPALREGVDLINEVLRAMALIDEAEGDLDAGSRERLLAFVETGEDFVRLGEDELEICLPFSSDLSAQFVRELLGQRSREGGAQALASAALDFLRELQVDADGLRMVFGSVDDLLPVMHFTHAQRTYSPDVLEVLDGSSLEVRADETMAKLLVP